MLGAELMVSAAVAALVCFNARPIAAPIGLIDVPDGGRKQHQGSIPLLGGVAVLPGLIWSYLAAEASFIVALALFYFCLGLLDDLFRLSARFRLTVGALFIVAVLFRTPQMVVPDLYFSGGYLVPLGVMAIPFTCLCILGFVNAVNMTDGSNGLLVGLTVLWASFLLLHAVPQLSLSFLGLYAALLVTLAFNFRGRVFLGDSGAYMLGAAIAATGIWVYNNSPTWTADGVVLMFIVPVIDCLRVMAARLIEGRSPMGGDRNHLHQLIGARWPKLVLVVYWSLVGVPNVLAFWFPALTPLWIVACLLGYVALVACLKMEPTGTLRPVESVARLRNENNSS